MGITATIPTPARPTDITALNILLAACSSARDRGITGTMGHDFTGVRTTAIMVRVTMAGADIGAMAGDMTIGAAIMVADIIAASTDIANSRHGAEGSERLLRPFLFA